ITDVLNNTSPGTHCSGSTCPVVKLSITPTAAPTSTVIVWGTDNTSAFNSAAGACPAPTNPTTISPFTSKGCVLTVPNPGGSGTGDYMFGAVTPGATTAVSLAALTSFQLVGMGNAGKWESSNQAGVRFITAMPITILTIGAPGVQNL